MIQIQTEDLKSTAAQMQSAQAEAALLRERTASLISQTRSLPYAAQALQRTKALQRQLEEIEAAYAQLRSGLGEVCRIAEETEEKVTEIYDSEQPAAGTFIVGRTRAFLNPNVERIARITWQS